MNVMKKMICMAALLLCSVATLKAQTPQQPRPPVPFNGSEFNGGNGKTTRNTIKGAGAPIAPATLLLLGLAGGFAGVKVYRNNKKEEE